MAKEQELNCEDCEECVYIEEGDFFCMKQEPRKVIEDYSTPTENYGWCKRRRMNGKQK